MAVRVIRNIGDVFSRRNQIKRFLHGAAIFERAKFDQSDMSPHVVSEAPSQSTHEISALLCPDLPKDINEIHSRLTVITPELELLPIDQLRESKLEQALKRLMKEFESGTSSEMAEVIMFLNRNFDALSLHECLWYMRLCVCVGRDPRFQDLLGLVLVNVADRVTYLLVSGPEQREEFIVSLLRECGLLARHFPVLENVVFWLLSAMSKDLLICEMRTLYRLRKCEALKGLILEIVDHVVNAPEVPLSSLCSAIDLKIALGSTQDQEAFLEKTFCRAVTCALSCENPAPLYDTLSNLVGSDLDTLWGCSAVHASIQRLVDSLEMYPKHPSEAHLILATAMARTGGRKLYRSRNAYALIDKALRVKSKKSQGNLFKLEICLAFKLPCQECSNFSTPRKGASDAALHYLTHFGSVILNQDSARIISMFACSRGAVPAREWSAMFERILELDGTASSDLALFLIAADQSDAPISLKAAIRQCLTPLIRMKIRNEDTKLCESFLRLCESGKDDICEIFRTEVFMKIIGSLRLGEMCRFSDLLELTTRVVPLIDKSRPDGIVSFDAMFLLRNALLKQSQTVAVVSNRHCVQLLSLRGPEWTPLVDLALAHVQIDQTSLEGLCILGDRIDLMHEAMRNSWKQHAYLNLLPADKDRLGPHSSIPDLLEAIRKKIERLDGLETSLAEGLGDLQLAFCSFLLTLTVTASLCDSYSPS